MASSVAEATEARPGPGTGPDLFTCDHFSAGRCGSCRWLPTPLSRQVATKVARAQALVSAAGLVWEEPATQPVGGFRNKAKMAVGGTLEAPTLGLVGLDDSSVDLQDCALHSPGLQAVLPVLAEFLTTARIAPYRLSERRGEVKHLLVTESPTGALLVRFVVRSREPETRIRKHLPGLLTHLPAGSVVSLNLQPEHKAVLEGREEIVLTESALLPMPLTLPALPQPADGSGGARESGGADESGGVGRTLPLALRPQGFFQTSTPMAAELYATAARWTADLPITSVWDLYSGVGGFALALAAPGRDVLGVEITPEAVAAGNAVAPAGVRFETGDATALSLTGAPDLVVVNPPRRGIGDLAERLEAGDSGHVLYSSCNATTLAADLARMPSLVPVRARVLDMFPHTEHFEVIVLLQRSTHREGPL